MPRQAGVVLQDVVQDARRCEVAHEDEGGVCKDRPFSGMIIDRQGGTGSA